MGSYLAYCTVRETVVCKVPLHQHAPHLLRIFVAPVSCREVARNKVDVVYDESIARAGGFV